MVCIYLSILTSVYLYLCCRQGQDISSFNNLYPAISNVRTTGEIKMSHRYKCTTKYTRFLLFRIFFEISDLILKNLASFKKCTSLIRSARHEATLDADAPENGLQSRGVGAARTQRHVRPQSLHAGFVGINNFLTLYRWR